MFVTYSSEAFTAEPKRLSAAIRDADCAGNIVDGTSLDTSRGDILSPSLSPSTENKKSHKRSIFCSFGTL